jgi:hypothetical protein
MSQADSQATVWRTRFERWPEATRSGLIALEEQDSFSLSLHNASFGSSGSATQCMAVGVIPGYISSMLHSGGTGTVIASAGTTISNAASTGAFGYLDTLTFAIPEFGTMAYPAGGIVTFGNGTLTQFGGGMVASVAEPLVNTGLLDLISSWNSEDSDRSDPGLEDEYKEFESNRLRFRAGS